MPGMAVDDEHALGAQATGDLGHDGREPRVVDAEQLPLGTGRVGERAEDVEDRADADLSARRAGVAHRGVQRLREQEADAGLVDAAADVGGVQRDVDPERLEHVRAPRRRGDRAVAVLGDRHAGPRHHERRRGRDVEGVQPVAARAAGVDVAGHGGTHRRGVLAHRPREADDLVDGLPLHAHAGDQRADLRRRRVAVHDLIHDHVRFVLGERSTRSPRARSRRRAS